MSAQCRVLIISKYYLTGEAFSTYLRKKSAEYDVRHRPLLDMTSVIPGFHPSILLFTGMEDLPCEAKSGMALYPFAKYLLVGRFQGDSHKVGWIRLGVHGLIEENDERTGLESLEQAISAALSGEIWASQEVLAEFFSSQPGRHACAGIESSRYQGDLLKPTMRTTLAGSGPSGWQQLRRL